MTTPSLAPTRHPRRGRFVAVAGVIALGAGLWVGLTVADGSAGPRTTPAPAFSLPRLGGGSPVSVAVGGHGRRPVVLTFFASWCTPCQTELPMIARVARHEQRSGVDVAFVGVDGNDDASSGEAMARSSGVSFPVAVDADSSVAPRYGLVGYPDTVFIDAGNHIVGTVQGPVTRAELTDWVARLARA